MPKKAAGLTVRQVQTKGPGLYADGGGLYLRVTSTEARMWLYRFQLHGRRRDMGLGPTDLYSLAEARQRAFEARKLVAEGVDPIEARQAKRSAAAIEMAKRMPSGHAPKPTSTRTGPAGVIRNTPHNGRRRSKPTSTRISAACLFKRLMSGWC